MSQGFVRDQQAAPTTFQGGQLTNQWQIQTVTSNYTVLTTDQTIVVDATSAGFTVSLPVTPLTGEKHSFPRRDSVVANDVGLSGNGNLILGDTIVYIGISPACLEVQWTGTEWIYI